MSLFLQSMLLPKISGPEVCDAIRQCYIEKGYEQVRERVLFDWNYADGEVRVFVISNDRCSVVSGATDPEETPDIRQVLSRFPIAVQLWARDGGWGYRLYEGGKATTALCSKRGLELPGESRAGKSSDLDRLVSACGIPSALERLRAIESGYFLFNVKAYTEFANALNAPVAALNFHDLDIANAGFISERMVDGWNCQMICFRKVNPDAGINSEKIVSDPLPTLSEYDRAEISRLQRKWKWLRLMTKPFALVAGLFVIPFVAAIGFVMLVSSIPWVRRMFLGKASMFLRGFIAQLRALEPQRIVIQGELVSNTRHGCSITVVPPAKAILDLPPRKRSVFDEQVFSIELFGESLSCVAFPLGREPKWASGVEVLEKRSLQIPEFEVQFERRRTTSTKQQWIQYEWTLRSRRAVYRFSNSRSTDWTSQQFNDLEMLVRSFKIG